MATVTERNGKYKITASLGYRQGKQLRMHLTWTPDPDLSKPQVKKELARVVADFERKCETGIDYDDTITFEEFSKIWLRDYATKQLRVNTVNGYVGLLERINAAIGDIRLAAIKPRHLLAFYDNLYEDGVRSDLVCVAKGDLAALLKSKGFTHRALEEASGVSRTTIFQAVHGKNVAVCCVEKLCAALEVKMKDHFEVVGKKKLSDNTVSHYHKLLSTMFTTAVYWQVIESNPCKRVKPPKVRRKEAKYLDEKGAAKLLALLDGEDEQFRAMVYTLLYTGFRRGEICGLKWEDINFDDETIEVKRTLIYTKETGVFFDETKTDASHRVLKVSSEAISILRQHRVAQMKDRMKQGAGWQDTGLVFTEPDGSPIKPNTAGSRFRSFIKRNDLPPISMHSMRHTNATLLISAGVNIRTVADRLGHAETSTTSDIYSHAIMSANAAAADTLSDILKPQSARSR